MFSLLGITNFIMVSDSGKNFPKKGENYLQWSNSKPVKEESEQLREILRYFNQILHGLPTWESPKDKEQNSNGAMGTNADAAVCDAPQASWHQSCERATAIDKLVAEAVARESAWLTVTFTAILKESNAVNMPTSLQVTSGAAGIKAIPPLTGLRTSLSTRDSNYGLKRLDTPLIAWKEIQWRLKFHISTIG